MADHLDGDIQLNIRHVTFLIEHLSGNASVWKSFGIALQFQKGDLDNIQGCLPLISNSPYSFMQRLVEEWLEGKYPHTAPPTLANLLKALNSHTVGLGTLAKQIRDLLPQHDQSISAKVFEIASVSDKGDIAFSRSEDIRVNEDTCVLLRVNIKSETKNCKWDNTGLVPMYYKNDKWSNKLTCNKLYSNNDKPTLCITKADIDMDGGQYFCKVKNESKPTTPVTLRVSCPQLDQFKKSLASIYLAQPEVPQDSWPPVINKTYINLALIKQQAINYGGEYARLTIRGDMDDILHNKEEIEYKNIFDGLRSGSLLLIEGRPGSGKTTFVYKITRDWAASEVQGPMRLVLLVSLRVLNGWEKPVTLKDILQLFNMRVSPEVLEERNGKGVCFTFDGLDEFSPLDGENSVVYKIINKTYLPQSIVIVASRPAALVKLRQKANKVIEVIGFPKDQILEYIKYYPFTNTSKAEELKSYLFSHPNVLHMCYLPIHAAMVAFLFEVMEKVPCTETEIYKHFTRFTLMRSLSKHKGQDELEDIDTDKLSGEEKELFDTICEFALEKAIMKKQVLDQSEMKLRLQGKGCKDISLGLVTVDRTAGLYGFKNIYTFLHLTYQEYLAAHHISILSDEDQHKLIKQYGDTDHMQVVWKFYCGLVNFEAHENKVKALISGRKNIVLSDIQCAYESQQKVVCNCFMKETNAQIILEDKYLTITDFTALGYLLSNSSIPISLSLTNCNVNVEAVSVLLKETEGKPLCLRALSYESQNTDLKSLTELLLQQHTLEYLKISYTNEASSYNTLDYYSFSDIVSTSLVNLKELSLTNISIKLDALQFCKELASLTLNGIFKKDDEIINPLLTVISKNEKLETVSCSVMPYNWNIRVFSICFTRTGTKFDNVILPTIQEDTNFDPAVYVQGIRGNYLQTLILEVNSIASSMDLKSSHEYWPPQPKLVRLNLFKYYDAVLLVTKCVSNFSALEELILRNTDIPSHTMPQEDLSHINSKAILTSLKKSSKLQKLVLNERHIDARVLVPCLQHWPKLQELHLRSCGIEEEGAKAIADSIKYCPELTEVDLSENDISNETLQMIKSSLQSHNEVTKSSSPSHNIFDCCTLF